MLTGEATCYSHSPISHIILPISQHNIFLLLTWESSQVRQAGMQYCPKRLKCSETDILRLRNTKVNPEQQLIGGCPVIFIKFAVTNWCGCPGVEHAKPSTPPVAQVVGCEATMVIRPGLTELIANELIANDC